MIEGVRAGWLNSLKFFLENIKPAPSHLMGSPRDNQERWLPLATFNAKYSEFCDKFGLKKVIVEEEGDLLKMFGLRVEKRLTEVYKCLRWKRADENTPLAGELPPNASSLSRFL